MLGRLKLALRDRRFARVSVGGPMCARGEDGLATCVGSGMGGGRPYTVDDPFQEVGAGSKRLCGTRAGGELTCWDGRVAGTWRLPLSGLSLACDGGCGLAPDGAPVCFGDPPGPQPDRLLLRIAGGEEVPAAPAGEPVGGIPGAEVVLAYCDRVTTVHGVRFGTGKWTLAGALDPRGVLRRAEGAEAGARGTWQVAGGAGGEHVRIGARCRGFALAATAPLRPAPAAAGGGEGSALSVGKPVGARWARVGRGRGDIAVGLVEEVYDPIAAGYSEADLKADWGDVGTGGLRPNRCFGIVARAGGEDQVLVLPEDCNEGD